MSLFFSNTLFSFPPGLVTFLFGSVQFWVVCETLLVFQKHFAKEIHLNVETIIYIFLLLSSFSSFSFFFFFTIKEYQYLQFTSKNELIGDWWGNFWQAMLLIRYQSGRTYHESVSERYFMISFTLYAVLVIGYSNPIAQTISLYIYTAVSTVGNWLWLF